MKQLSTLLLALFCLSCAVTYGQDGDANSGGSTISVAVVMPPAIQSFTDAQMSMLEDRIKDIVSMNGLSAEGSLDGFLIYPKFDINGTQTVTLPLGNMTVVKCTLSLFVRQYIPNSTNGLVFSSFNRDIAGNGNSASEAISNAITQIRPDDEALQAFMTKARTKIVSYYVQHCEQVMNEAQHAADLQNYDKAFALLLSIPKEATQCYNQVQQKAAEYYLSKQRHDCNRYIVEAKTFAAAHEYDSALAVLKLVDPESVCRDDLAAVLNDIVTRVDENEKKNWEYLIERLHDSTDIEKARVTAESDLAKAYLEGAGRQVYVVNGSGPNATVQLTPPVPAPNTPGQPLLAPGQTAPNNAASDGLLNSTTLQPDFNFGNNIFPSFIISRANASPPDVMKKYGDIFSCIGMTLTNPTMSGTVTYEIEPVEDKYFSKVTGSIDVVRGQTVEYFPSIPWKFEALKNIQQSTPLNIRFRLIDNAGRTKEQLVKVSVRSIQECITSYLLDGKVEMSPTLAAYVNEENPQIDKLLAEGIQKKWVNQWTGYQEGPEGLDKQVKTIWKILSEKGIHYSDITGATTNNSGNFASQIVRPFCESIADKQANCVEGTLLFASILKRISIRPVMVLVPGHCFLAFHPTDSDTDQYVFLETTILGNITGEPSEAAFEKNYQEAILYGADEFKKADKSKVHLIDIEAVRRQNIGSINLPGTCN